MSKSEWLDHLLKKIRDNTTYGNFNTNNVNPHISSYDTTSVNYGGRQDYWIPDWDSGPSKRKHEFSPVLLINTTVYDCKHCKRKKEECTSEYCEDEDSPPDYQNIGDWG